MDEVAATDPNNPPRYRVLIVSDGGEQAIGSLSARLTQETGFETSGSDTMEEGLTRAQTEWPSLVILDLKKRTDAIYLCRTLKADHGTGRIPIIIVNASNETNDRIAALEAGADDCIGRPCNPREIVLRAMAVLRRGVRTTAEEHLVQGPIRVDPARCHVAVENRSIHLTAVEFKLLQALVKQPGQVQSREMLLGEARGHSELGVESRTIDTHIRRLRGKLGKAAYLVETVRGSGYRLRPT
ncbi:MAG: response regulator transcription factor [Chthoniobacterales bacterium]